MTFKADLHIHSCYSDGLWTLEQLFAEAKERNLQALSITDHDTLKAYPKALTLGRQNGIEVLTGIELSSHFSHIPVHVLGYGIALDNQELLEAISAISAQRTHRILSMSEKLKRRGVNIELEDLRAQFPTAQLGRPHLAHQMVKQGYVKDINQAFDDYLGDRYMNGLKLQTLGTEEAIELIHNAGGYAVLAHPHTIKQRKKLRQLLGFNFDGLEAYYANCHDRAPYYVDLAQQFDLLVTGGSDFHKPSRYQSLGCSFTPLESYQKLAASTAPLAN